MAFSRVAGFLWRAGRSGASGQRPEQHSCRGGGGYFALIDYQSPGLLWSCAVFRAEAAGGGMRRGRRRGKMAMEGPRHQPPSLVPLLMSVTAVLISHHVFNAAAQIPDPEVRAARILWPLNCSVAVVLFVSG